MLFKISICQWDFRISKSKAGALEVLWFWNFCFITWQSRSTNYMSGKKYIWIICLICFKSEVYTTNIINAKIYLTLKQKDIWTRSNGEGAYYEEKRQNSYFILHFQSTFLHCSNNKLCRWKWTSKRNYMHMFRIINAMLRCSRNQQKQKRFRVVH